QALRTRARPGCGDGGVSVVGGRPPRAHRPRRLRELHAVSAVVLLRCPTSTTRQATMGSATASPPPLAVEGQGGGMRSDGSVKAHPLPTPPPQAGEGADRVRRSC